jgi:cyclophilin family peptidyl-prolyl cis-trans isomerase
MSQPRVELHILDMGVITLELDADKAPKSVANFLAYVNKGHYDKTIFHRVIGNFMIQVDKIRAVKTGRRGFHDDVPKEDVVIEKAVAL